MSRGGIEQIGVGGEEGLVEGQEGLCKYDFHTKTFKRISDGMDIDDFEKSASTADDTSLDANDEATI